MAMPRLYPIPVGAIEAEFIEILDFAFKLFQFQWVRLRPVCRAGNRSFPRVSIPVGAIEAVTG